MGKGLWQKAYVQCHLIYAMGVSPPNHGPMLDEEDLAPADKLLLDMLSEGRITAPYAAHESDYSVQYLREQLARLVEHGNARKVYDGLYEIVEDPRESRRDTSDG